MKIKMNVLLGKYPQRQYLLYLMTITDGSGRCEANKVKILGLQFFKTYIVDVIQLFIHVFSSDPVCNILLDFLC